MRTKLSKIAHILLILIIGAIGVQTITSCSGDDGGGGDSQCGLNGRTVKIGEQVWMAENLNCNVSGSVCNDNDPANCAKYGRLYNWITAMALPDSCKSRSCYSQISTPHKGICPSGWHLPGLSEWNALITAAGGREAASMELKATSGWYLNGLDSYGFAALPSGFGWSDGSFGGAGDGLSTAGGKGYWWTSIGDFDYADYVYIADYTDWSYSRSGYFYSVRCLKD